MNENLEWKFYTAVVEKQCVEINGINIWDYKWNTEYETVFVKDPNYGELKKMTKYWIHKDNETIDFVSGEFSNTIFGIYLKTDLLEKQQKAKKVSTLKKIVSKIKKLFKNNNHTKEYETFLHDYFTGHGMIRFRGEEDSSVWTKLEGKELETAKLKIIDSLDTYDESYIRAVGIFKDERAIESLKKIVEKAPESRTRLYAAKTLYDWKGFDKYLLMLNNEFDNFSSSSKIDLAFWIRGIDENNALKFFWKTMNDSNGYVRYCSYEALEKYYGIWKFRNDGGVKINYYTNEEIYQDKELFKKRQTELKEIINNWKKTKPNTVYN
jgi:hypothetical protein